jgi:cell pole-organizing protein PopZ
MSAAQPKAAEPSMEEILASIRRIISDEPVKPQQTAAAASDPPKAAAAPPAPESTADDDEIMDLTPKAKTKAAEPHFIADDPVENDVSFAEPAPAAPKSQDEIDALMSFDAPPPAAAAPPVAAPPVAAPPVAHAPAAPSEARLISAEADRAATAAFSSLASTILTRNARTLEDLMQEMMRPMIKAWLDDNLPTVVERLVKAEIERVSRGGR